MSLFSYPFGREALLAKQLTTTDVTTLYTAGNNGAAVVALSVNEIAGATPTISLDIYSGSAVVARRSVTRALAGRENWSAITLAGAPIVLSPGYSLRAQASAANQIDIDGVVIEPDQR